MTGRSDTYGDVRRRVLAGLGLIVLEGGGSDEEGRARRERRSFDLIRFWFDVVWAPGLRYMDGFKGDRDPAREAAFRETFSDEEFLWLERFNRFLELRVDRLHDDERTQERFPAGDTWTAIVRDAANLLELLDPSGRQRLPEKKLLEAYRERPA
ncbi:MAG: hypothetical protein HKN17_05630 [Rhodothermales bacterium]|nr:hypothetical protein [Rhodothermales bacterium]